MDAYGMIVTEIAKEIKKTHCYFSWGGELTGSLSPTAIGYRVGRTALDLIVKNNIDITEFTSCYAEALSGMCEKAAIQACASAVKSRKAREKAMLMKVEDE